VCLAEDTSLGDALEAEEELQVCEGEDKDEFEPFNMSNER
jgi:hypothetical protein